MNYQTAHFTPITLTAETLQVLCREEDKKLKLKLLALYISYVEITTWQGTNTIKATSEFMMKRLAWSKTSFSPAKRRLIELGLIQDVQRRENDQKIIGHYILVKHVINEKNHPMAHTTLWQGIPPSTNNLNKSTNNLNDLKSNTYVNENFSLLEEDKEEKVDTGKKPPAIDKAREVLDYYQKAAKVTNKTYDKSVAIPRETTSRMNKIKLRLKTFTVKECQQAIKNLLWDDWYTGNNQTNWKCTIDYLFRNDEQVERFMNHNPKKPERPIE